MIASKQVSVVALLVVAPLALAFSATPIKPMPPTASNSLSKPYDSLCAYLGKGYDVLKGCGESVNAFEIILPCDEEIKTGCSTSVSESTGKESQVQVSTMSEKTDMMSTSSSFEGGGFGVTASASATFVSESSMSSTSLSFVSQAFSSKCKVYVNYAQDLKLASAYKDSILDEGNAYPTDADMPDKYYVQGIHYGGAFMGYYNMEATTNADSTELDVAAGMSAGFAFSVEGSTEFNEATSAMSDKIAQTSQVWCSGGSCSLSQAPEGTEGIAKVSAVQAIWYDDYQSRDCEQTEGMKFDLALSIQSTDLLATLNERISIERAKSPDSDQTQAWEAKKDYYQGGQVTPVFMDKLATEYQIYEFLKDSLTTALGPGKPFYTTAQVDDLERLQNENDRQLSFFQQMDEATAYQFQVDWENGDDNACVGETCAFIGDELNDDFLVIYNSIDHSPPPPSPPPPPPPTPPPDFVTLKTCIDGVADPNQGEVGEEEYFLITYLYKSESFLGPKPSDNSKYVAFYSNTVEENQNEYINWKGGKIFGNSQRCAQFGYAKMNWWLSIEVWEDDGLVGPAASQTDGEFNDEWEQWNGRRLMATNTTNSRRRLKADNMAGYTRTGPLKHEGLCAGKPQYYQSCDDPDLLDNMVACNAQIIGQGATSKVDFSMVMCGDGSEA